jgi:hypothetical protein
MKVMKIDHQLGSLNCGAMNAPMFFGAEWFLFARE